VPGLKFSLWALLAAVIFGAWSWRDQMHGNDGKSIELNQAVLHTPPKWLRASRVQKIVDKIQGALEWEIRKVQVYWYTDQAAFEKAHGLGPTVRAAAKRVDQSVHLGPKVDDRNFDGIFGHELVHVVVFQKYKDAIPKWLDEGLANHISRKEPVNFAYLAAQPPRDILRMDHPFEGGEDPGLVYQTSTAVMLMIAERCSIKDLLQLSVGKKLESYLKTYCEISDLSSDFHAWVKKKAAKRPPRSP
jgi:hypothetical protein